MYNDRHYNGYKNFVCWTFQFPYQSCLTCSVMELIHCKEILKGDMKQMMQTKKIQADQCASNTIFAITSRAGTPTSGTDQPTLLVLQWLLQAGEGVLPRLHQDGHHGRHLGVLQPGDETDVIRWSKAYQYYPLSLILSSWPDRPSNLETVNVKPTVNTEAVRKQCCNS